MSTWSTNAVPAHRSWLGRAEDWLDDRGKFAWIAAMVLSFILFWPVGLALLAYMIWSKRMFSNTCAMTRNARHGMRHGMHARHFGGLRSSGNTAFDSYKADTLDRLEREQHEFESFLARLRASKDKAEFDQYMEERARAARSTDDEGASDADGARDATPGDGQPGRY
jgi:hypothetical protein